MASTADAARAIAQTFGHDVIVDSETSPTMLVTAHANGGFTSEASIVPARVKQDGEWVAEDTTLAHEEEGWVSPAAAAAPVQFSTGGGTEIARVRSSDGMYMTESWPYGTLPTPRVEGSTATYSNVLPDVDLKLSATEVGMSEVLVVKTPAAQANPELKSLEFQLHGASPSIDPDTKTVEATTPSGAVIGSGTPLWWDSSADGAAFDTAGAAEPKALKYTTPSSDTVSLDVGSVASSPEVQYPLYVDPDWSTNNAYLMADWYDDRAVPDQSYFDPPEDSVGYGIQNGVAYLSRAFFQFNTSNLAGRTINSSHLGMLQTYANSCDTTLVQAWRYDSTATGFSWNHEVPAWAQLLDQQGNANGGPCAPNPATVGWDVTQGTAYAASHSQGSLTLGLRVADEGNSLTRKHYQWNATLVTTYDTPPAAPTNLKFAYASPVGSKGCGTAQNPTLITTRNDQKVPMAATLSDADLPTAAQALHGVFYVNDMQSGKAVAVASYTSPNGASGSVFSWNWNPGTTGVTDGHLYKWYIVPTDGILAGPHSIDCYFRVYTSLPEADIKITFPTNPTDPTKAPTIGALDQVSLALVSASSRVAGFLYWSTPTDDPGNAPKLSLDSFTKNVSIPCANRPQVTNSDGTVWGLACNSTSVTIPVLGTTMSVGAVPYDAVGLVGEIVRKKNQTFSPDMATSFSSEGHAWYFDGESYTYDPNGPVPAMFDDENQSKSVALTTGTDATAIVDPTPNGNGYALNYTGVTGGTPSTTSSIRLSSSSSSAGSMSMSVWVKPSTLTGSYAALSQRGNGPGWASILSVNAGNPSFCVHSQVSTKQACVTARAQDPSQPFLSTTSWTMLTGVWDAANKQVRLLINASITPVAAAPFTDDPADPGVTSPLILGAISASAGQAAAGWKGELDDPVAVPGVLTATQLNALYQQKRI